MATATISGTITFPIATGGPNASMIIGAPSVTPSSTTGPQLTFTEKSSNTYKVTVAGGATDIPFGTVADADLVYIGTDQGVSIVFNGGTDTFTLPIGGFILMFGASLTAIEVTATGVDANIDVLIMGD